MRRDMTNPAFAQFLERFHRDYARDADLFPQNLDPLQRKVLVVAAAQGALEEASFLDDRMLTPGMAGGWLSFEDFLLRAREAAEPAGRLGYIFHVGHCGSTLLSRLLAFRPGDTALREPQILRVLAEASCDIAEPWAALSEDMIHQLLDGLVRSWARPRGEASRVIVKATSLASGLGPDLLELTPQARAIALHMKLEPYLAALLAPETPSVDLSRGARVRFGRLKALLGDPGWRLHQLSLGELAAASWLCEASAMADLAATHPDAVHALDFDDFLAAPGPHVLQAANHMGLGWTEPDAHAALASPIMQRYSKAPEHQYGPDLRRQVLDDSRRRNAGEIAAGRAFVGRMLSAHPVLKPVEAWTV
jgi:hypothetical protein